MSDDELALVAVKVACVLVRVPAFDHLAHRLARAAIARDRGEILYGLRIAANARVGPRALISAAVQRAA